VNSSISHCGRRGSHKKEEKRKRVCSLQLFVANFNDLLYELMNLAVN